MATEVAKLYGTLTIDDKKFKMGVSESETALSKLAGAATDFGKSFTKTMYRAGRSMIEMGGQMSALGGSLTTLTAPLMDFAQQSVGAATDFDEAMKNVQAAAGYTNQDMIDIAASVREIGAASRYGPQAAADAFYEIAGGVSNASARMEVFNQAIATAEAGNADLVATTSALIAVTNAYGLEAYQVAGASDVLTRMVGMGKGSMDEFAAAIPKAATAAADLGINLQDVGAMMAFLTTKGFTAAESSTMLSNMMTTLINPTKEVSDAIQAMGYESGRAMIQQEGLAGAYKKLAAYNGGELDGLVTNVEALRGATALATDEFAKFGKIFGEFSTNIGSTSAAGQSGFMAGFDGAKVTSFSKDLSGATDAARAIQLESAAAQFDLLESSIANLRVEVGNNLMPVLTDLTKNVLMPLVQGVMDWVQANPQAVVSIMILVGAAAILGTALTVAGTAIGAIGTALTVLSGPIGLAILAVGLLAAAYATNLGGIKDFVEGTVGPVIGDFIKTLQGIWDTVGPGLMDLAGFFVTGAVQNMINVFKFILGVAKSVIDVLKGIWDAVSPGVKGLHDGIMRFLGPVLEVLEGVARAISGVKGELGAGFAGPSETGHGGNLVGAITGKASGGPIYGPSIVGEQGRELFFPGVPGTIIPNPQTEQMMGGVTFNGPIVVNANDAAGGAAAGDAFVARVREQFASRGGR